MEKSSRVFLKRIIGRTRAYNYTGNQTIAIREIKNMFFMKKFGHSQHIWYQPELWGFDLLEDNSKLQFDTFHHSVQGSKVRYTNTSMARSLIYLGLGGFVKIISLRIISAVRSKCHLIVQALRAHKN